MLEQEWRDADALRPDNGRARWLGRAAVARRGRRRSLEPSRRRNARRSPPRMRRATGRVLTTLGGKEFRVGTLGLAHRPTRSRAASCSTTRTRGSRGASSWCRAPGVSGTASVTLSSTGAVGRTHDDRRRHPRVPARRRCRDVARHVQRPHRVRSAHRHGGGRNGARDGRDRRRLAARRSTGGWSAARRRTGTCTRSRPSAGRTPRSRPRSPGGCPRPRAPCRATAAGAPGRTRSCTGRTSRRNEKPIVPAAFTPPTSMNVSRKIPRGPNASPSLRKKISIPGCMKTPFGPSLIRWSSTNRSRNGISVSWVAVTMANGPVSASSLRAFRLISCRSFDGKVLEVRVPGPGERAGTGRRRSGPRSPRPRMPCATAASRQQRRATGDPRGDRAGRRRSSRRRSSRPPRAPRPSAPAPRGARPVPCSRSPRSRRGTAACVPIRSNATAPTCAPSSSSANANRRCSGCSPNSSQ